MILGTMVRYWRIDRLGGRQPVECRPQNATEDPPGSDRWTNGYDIWLPIDPDTPRTIDIRW